MPFFSSIFGSSNRYRSNNDRYYSEPQYEYRAQPRNPTSRYRPPREYSYRTSNDYPIAYGGPHSPYGHPSRENPSRTSNACPVAYRGTPYSSQPPSYSTSYDRPRTRTDYPDTYRPSRTTYYARGPPRPRSFSSVRHPSSGDGGGAWSAYTGPGARIPRFGGLNPNPGGGIESNWRERGFVLPPAHEDISRFEIERSGYRRDYLRYRY